MNLVFLVVAYFLQTATFVSSKPQLQFALPARARLPRETGFTMEDLPLDEEASNTNTGSSIRFQEALSSLLALNDGELKALMMGVPIDSIAENLSVQTSFLLRASRDSLLKLQTLLKAGESGNRQFDDFRIARRGKKLRPLRTIPEVDRRDSHQQENNAGPNSLLKALVDLSQHLEEQDSNEIHSNNVQPYKNNYFSSGSSQRTHFSYWLKAAECPESNDGTSRIYCPSPRIDMEWYCIPESQLCDGQSQCPKHEDEDPHSCMFYKGLKSQLNVLVDGLLHVSSRRS